ncbi:MAG: dTDP-4-dehydrorhamnose reductase [Coriobacteriia bacterium]
MTRFLIAGSCGMLGSAFRRVLTERKDSFFAPRRSDFDITDERTVAATIGAFAETLDFQERGVVLNAAAYTDVERAEDDSDAAYRVNEYGAALLARVARDHDLALVHVSTDFVFDGCKQGAYSEADHPNPLSVYGDSKLAGERAVLSLSPTALVIRTAWVFGSNGANFPLKILDAARKHRSLRVVADEIGSPTYSVDLARGILRLVDISAEGLFHLAGFGSCSRFELAVEVLRAAGLEDVPVIPVASAAFPTKALRPTNSTLDSQKAASLGVVMPPWQDAVARFLAEIEVSAD